MTWNAEWITKVALLSAAEDYAVFEAIGLQEIENACVLDVGCFDGFNTHLKFAPYANIERVVGIDPSAVSIAAAHERCGGGRFSFTATSFDDYVEGDDRFDVVYMAHVLQHLENPADAVKKAYSLLKPGGFLVAKTVDDGAKLSYPDPNHALRKVLDLYEQHVLPNIPRTACTDRYLGRKCHALFRRAGFENVSVATFTTDTVGMTVDERLELYERSVYFRRAVPAQAGTAAAGEMSTALAELRQLFLNDEYYYSTASFVAVGQRLEEGMRPVHYCPGSFRRACPNPAADRDENTLREGRGFTIRPMEEADIPAVMAIEIASFQSPWTPLAYLAELRYNPDAHYDVAVGKGGAVVGYAGAWYAGKHAHIVRIATDPSQRKHGIGRLLLDAVLGRSKACSKSDVTLEVRASNGVARSFYRAAGFAEVDVWADYYTDPPDDAVLMARPIG